MVTATVATDEPATARVQLEDALVELESRYPATPGGGPASRGACPYFPRHVPAQWERLQPSTSPPGPGSSTPSASRAMGGDPSCEQNDVAVLIRSDSLDAIAWPTTGNDDLDVLSRTTVRRGFAGGGLPSKLAVGRRSPGRT